MSKYMILCPINIYTSYFSIKIKWNKLKSFWYYNNLWNFYLKTLIKEINDDVRKWIDKTCYWIVKFNIMKMLLCLIQIKRMNTFFYHIMVLHGDALWYLHMCLQYILVIFTPTSFSLLHTPLYL
jgi:hypothetical protein